MNASKVGHTLGLIGAVALMAVACNEDGTPSQSSPSTSADGGASSAEDNAERLIEEGRQTFRFDTFGDEEFWGGTLRLHEAIAGEANGGVGEGVSPNAALGLGLKVDMEALPAQVVSGIQAGTVNLDDPATTLTLLQLNAVVGVTGFFADNGQIESLGIQCAFCHSTVDDAFAPGIGRRRDGWANRDLNVGAIIAAAADLSALTELFGVNESQLRDVLLSWGPGKYDAELILDGKTERPDGDPAATLLPPAFGLAGVNLHTYTGWGSVPYWNAQVAILNMHGQGTFYDPRLKNADKFPIAAAQGFDNVRSDTDRVTPKLAALHVYQLALEAPRPPTGSYDAAAAERGGALFSDRAKCASCHVPPLFTEPGWNLHTGDEIGIDNFQALRSPDERYRTTPLKGLWTHQKGGFYHDGRFATLRDVIDHYNGVLSLSLSQSEKSDLEEYLKSL